MEVSAAQQAEQQAAALFAEVPEEDDEDDTDGEPAPLDDAADDAGAPSDAGGAAGASAPSVGAVVERKVDLHTEMLKGAADMRAAFSRRFSRHSRNVSAPPELSKLAGLRSSMSGSSADGSPSTSGKLDDFAAPPAEEPPRAQGTADATGRTGNSGTLSTRAPSWGTKSKARAPKATRAQSMPEVHLEVLQAEIVVSEELSEGAEPESFSRC
mmetsp:Transcript_46307/g.128750  ORF Transcript_46307/g.128750 Transcript_46307/m.128750 type:complete len:212 (+) Transcript_46307:55-690(+)